MADAQHDILDELLDRDAEINLFRAAQEFLGEGQSIKRILNFNGAGGIGKTCLLNSFSKHLEPGWKLVYIPLEGNEPESQVEDVESFASLLEKKIKQADLKLTDPTSVSHDEAELSPINSLVGKLADYLENNRLVLVIDGITQTKPWFGQLEQLFFSRLLNKPLLTVIGSRAPLRLERFELRLQLQPISVKPLPQKALNSPVLANFFDLEWSENARSEAHKKLLKLIKPLYALCYGHPGALVHLLVQIKNHNDRDPLNTLQDSRRLKAETGNYITKNYIFGKSFSEKLSERRLNEISKAINEISIYRRFDLTMLREATLNSKDPTVAQVFAAYKNDDIYFTKLSQDIVRTYIVDWDGKQRGFVMEDSYRNILCEALRAVVQEASFRERHEIAVNQYCRLLRSQNSEADTRAIYLIELLYHLPRGNRKKALQRLIQLDNLLKRDVSAASGPDAPGTAVNLPDDSIEKQPQSIELIEPLENLDSLFKGLRLPDISDIQVAFKSRDNLEVVTPIRHLDPTLFKNIFDSK